MSLLKLREKKGPVRPGGFGFIPKGPIGKTGVPAKQVLRGDSTVGLSYKPEAQ